VVTRPPERITLGGCGADQREDKLKGPAGLEGFVGKVAVVSGGQRKDVQQVHGPEDRPGRRTPLREENTKTAGVHEE
jgi:hypothetical protein